jgi:hypothetical protein
VADVNRDGAPDILTAGRHGAFVFLNQTPALAVRPARSRPGLSLSDPPFAPAWDLNGRQVKKSAGIYFTGFAKP